MENQLKLIGGRIAETRKILNIPLEEMAQITGMSPEEYLAHERGETDHSFTFIYHCAERFGVDISALVLVNTVRYCLDACEVSVRIILDDGTLISPPVDFSDGTVSADTDSGKSTRILSDLASPSTMLTVGSSIWK